MSDLSQLYRQTILRHAGKPTGFRRDIEATHRHEEYNPLCGDRIEISLRIDNGQIADAAFDGEACTICMASASMLCATVPGSPAVNLAELSRVLIDSLAPGTTTPPPGELAALDGVRNFPSRVQCATLPWKTAARAAMAES